MAAGVNKVTLIGNLGADPDLRHTQAGTPVCTLSLATNESYKDRDGEKQERTEWHRIVVWSKRAEVVAKYLSKGRQVYVEGKLRTKKWEDKEGNTRYTTEIVAHDVQFLSGGGDGSGSGAPAGSTPAGDPFGGPDDDIPF